MTAKFDHPGNNVTTQPQRAPNWLRALAEPQVTDFTDYLPNRSAAEFNLPEPKVTKHAAVLVLFGGAREGAANGVAPDDATILLTHRNPSMRSHSGQIAFPGGRIDATDVSPVDAALREAWEETGLDRHSVLPLSQLDPLMIPVTGNKVHPVLSYWENESSIAVTRPQEADDVFAAPISELVDPANRVALGFNDWVSPGFYIRDYLVWGFTAGVLNAIFHHSGWEKEWDREHVHDLWEALAKSRNNEVLR